MNNIRLPLAALLAPVSLTMLLFAGQAGAALTLDTTFDTDGLAEVNIGAGVDAARGIAVASGGALVLAGTSRQTIAADTIDYVALTRLNGTTGALDTTFGSIGKVTFLPGLSATNGGGGVARAVAIQSLDQKIVVAGTWKASAAATRQVFVARLGADGVLDGGFGTDGVTLLTPAGVTDPAGNAIAIRSDGSIVVAGSGTAVGTAGVGFVIVLDGSGALDSGFTPAVVPNPLPAPGGAGFGFNAVTVLPGDRILAAGGGGDLTLAQFTSAGVPDTNFDGDGIATFNFLSFDDESGPQSSFDLITALKVLGDGRVLIAGRWGQDSLASTANPLLARVAAGGALDSTFGSAGFAPLPITGSGRVPSSVGVRSSGDIVLVGPLLGPTQVSPNGIALGVAVDTGTTTLADLAVLADDSVVAAGERRDSLTNTTFGTARLTATDLPDGPDAVPDPFSFATQTGREPGIDVTSNTVTITGITAAAPVTVAQGTMYSIGCTASFVATAGSITDGESVCLRRAASQADLSVAFAQIFVGGVQGVFSIVTGDATPDSFDFVNQTSVAVGTTVTSNTITLSGLNTRTDVSITGTGSTYSVGCSVNFTAGVTRVDPGAQICVRHTSSAIPGADTTTTLSVGVGTKVTRVFTSTTIGDTTPDAFNFVDAPGFVGRSTVVTSAGVTLTGFDSAAPISVTGGTYSIGCTASYTAVAGTVAPNSTVCVRHTSSAAGGTATNTTLTVGPNAGVSNTFTSTTEGTPDTTPDPFNFADQAGVPLVAVITSGARAIGGFDTNTTVSVTGGTYSVGCGASFTANPSTNFAPNSLVCVRHTSAPTGGTVTSTVLTVGGVSDTFTSTTLPGDAVPTDFSFVDQTGVDLSAPITSAPVTITGIDIPSPVSVTGGEYSIGCNGTFTRAPASISSGQTVCVRQTSSFDSNTPVSTTLTISTVSGTFTSTTRAGDQTPDDFSFPSQSGVALGTLATSDMITITGIDSPAAVTASGPLDSFGRPLYGFSVGCTGSFGGSNGDLIDSGETLCVTAISAATDSTGVVITVTIGGRVPGTQKSATYTVTTGETVPDQFTFTDQVAVELNAIPTSDPITITGITAPSKVEIESNGQYQLNCTGSFTSADGLIKDGDTICVRHRASAIPSTVTSTELTIGGVRDTFTSTTTAEQSLPGGSSMGLWSLLLAPLVVYRRRTRARRSAFRRDAPTARDARTRFSRSGIRA